MSPVGYSYIIIEDNVTLSGYQELSFDNPQGALLGPTIYCIYTKPVSDIVQQHKVSHHSYADDNELYMTMDH